MTNLWIGNSLDEKYNFQFHLKEFHTMIRCIVVIITINFWDAKSYE